MSGRDVLVLAAGAPTGAWIAGGIAFVALLWFFGTYNGLVRARQHCRQAWSRVETELQRRYDLVPRLVETVRGYARHERDVLERVLEARGRALANRGTPQAQARDENVLVALLRRVFVLAEGYPRLRSSDHFLELQRALVTTEDRIQRARRYYNAGARELANRIETFPAGLVARAFGFQRVEYFEIETGAAAPPSLASHDL